uniref:Uncharacterized protein n=1 Tax=Rhizophora mucronata TaxID=61149 RepID=A0A2P2QZC0_RHIMU
MERETKLVAVVEDNSCVAPFSRLSEFYRKAAFFTIYDSQIILEFWMC